MNFFFHSKNFALKIFAGCIIFLICQSNLNAQKKPNVIFILGDDIGYDLLSVNGSKSYSTPNIDSMAHHGINFTHCEGSPLCAPSRSMLLTGKYNFRNYSNWGYMNDDEKTFGNVMHDAGYKTGFFGKLQLPFSNQSMANWGFDKYTLFELTEDSLSPLRYKSPSLVDNYGRVPDSIVQNKYCDDILTSRIFNFIDSNANNPFFIYYAMPLAHAPFSPTPNDTAYANWNANSNRSDTSFYRSMIKYMDSIVGLIIDKISKAGLEKNTIIIFAGDNGVPFQIYYNVDDDTYIEGEKRATTEGGTHVPLIAYWPSHIQPDQANDDLIDFTDFLPTFAEAAGVKNLSAYGTIDGLSFYNRMLGVEDASKPQLFMHYCAHPSFEFFRRWVRDKTYKLYDSSSSFKFYNIIKDGKEQNPLSDEQLTKEEKAIKARFQFILDSMPTWGDAPELSDPFVSDITSTSATIRATILNSGSAQLIDQGSNIISGQDPILGKYRLHYSTVGLGLFSQNRTDLNSQTLYNYSLYAMNASENHNTGYAQDKFYTLSAPPVLQPSYFKACADSSSILLSWGKAIFPARGASEGGYAIFYSKDSIQLIDNSNGQNPLKITKNGTLIPLATKPIHDINDISVRLSGLQKNLKYYFLLVPYTYNGTTDSTCNYLTAGVLSATLTYKAPLNLNFTDKNPTCFNSKDGNIKASAFNGTSPYNFSINNKDYTPDPIFNRLSAGKYLLTAKDVNGCLDSAAVVLKPTSQNCIPDINIFPNPSNSVFEIKFGMYGLPDKIVMNVYDISGSLIYTKKAVQNSSYTFGKSFIQGSYFVEIKSGTETYKFKIVKN